MIFIVGIFLFQILAHAADGAAGAHAANEVGDFAFAVFPDFRAGGLVMGFRIHRIVVLVGIEGIGNFARQFFGDGIIAARIVGLDGGGADDDFGAERFEQVDFFLGLLVRDGENHFVAAHRGDERQSHAGIAGSAFNDGAAGLEQALFFGVVNHGDADAVFHGAAGIDVIGFDVDLRLEALVDAIETDQWSAADGLKNVVAAHVASSLARGRNGRERAPRWQYANAKHNASRYKCKWVDLTEYGWPEEMRRWHGKILPAGQLGSRSWGIRGRCAWEICQCVGNDCDGAGREDCWRRRCGGADGADYPQYRMGTEAGRSYAEGCGANKDFCDEHCGMGKNWASAWGVFCRDTSGDEHGAGERADFAGDFRGD